MKRILGNFLTQADKSFPVDCETLDMLQQGTTMTAILGNIAGDKAILWGCELAPNGITRSSGYVFLRTRSFPEGEILFWEGGNISLGMYVKEATTSITAEGYIYPQAYVARSLAPGIGSENYTWSGFIKILTNRELEAYCKRQDDAIAALAPPPLGIVQTWAGKVGAADIPEDYALCDGRQLAQAEYPGLYKAIGRLHTPSGVGSGYFCLPDLRSQFIVGYSPADTDYNTIGKKGGQKTIALTVDQIPPHSHTFNDYYYIEAYQGGVDGNDPAGSVSGSGDTDGGNQWFWYKQHDTQNKGGGASHENRPPYYTLAYIMRLK